MDVIQRIKKIQADVAEGRTDLRKAGVALDNHFDQDFPALLLELALTEAQRKPEGESAMMKPMGTVFDELAKWSDKAFGTPAERGPIGALKHLKMEADEAIAEPSKLEEYVDCLFLSLDAARRAGFTYDQIVDGAWVKLAVLWRREHPDPATQPKDVAIEHIRVISAERIGGTDDRPIISARIDPLTAHPEARREQVDHPPHYGGADDPFEVIKVIEAWDLNFSLGSALKYIRRRKEKGDELTNLKKARWCIDREIQRMEGAK